MPVSGKVAEMELQQLARQAAAAPGTVDGDRDRKYFGFVGGHPRDDEADDLAAGAHAMRQRIAFSEQLVEFAFAPATVKRCAMQLGQP